MYPYSTLSATTKDIRLLRLMPGSGDDPIEASLSTESLQSEPIYEVGPVTCTRPSDLVVQVYGLHYLLADDTLLRLSRMSGDLQTTNPMSASTE